MSQPVTLLKKRLRHKCFLVNFEKFLRRTFVTERLRWLLPQFSLYTRSLLSPLRILTDSFKNSFIGPSLTFGKNNEDLRALLSLKILRERGSYRTQLNIIKDTHREKAPANKTPALTRSRNIGTWVVGTSNQLFIRAS